MNTQAKTQTQTAAAIPCPAHPVPAANVAVASAISTEQPAPGQAGAVDLTTVDEMVFAIEQAAANEPQATPQPPQPSAQAQPQSQPQTPVQPQQQKAATPPVYSLGDVGNAERFFDLWGEVTRYDVGRACWMLWSRTHWESDAKGDALNRMVKVGKHILNVEAEVHRLASKEPDDWDAIQARKLKKEGQRLHSVPALEAGLKLASRHPELATLTNEFDRNPMEFNCLSGVIDLASGVLQPHTPRHLNAHIAPVALAPAGTPCPRWMQFLNEIMCGDKELMDYLQRVVGYILTGRMEEQCFFVFYGNGLNGKSTFNDVLRNVMGTYAKDVEKTTFQHLNRGAAPRNDLAALAGARFVVCPEWQEGAALDEATVKTFTGGDMLSVRFLFKESFSLKPVGKIVLATNHKPVVNGTDNGIWRRMRLVPFLAKFDQSKADLDLPNKLKAELPAILRWAVEGALLWQQHGLGIPAAVAEANKSYRSDMDVFQTFIDERCDVSPMAQEGSQPLYNGYADWCQTSGMRSKLTLPHFTRRLKELGFVHKKTSAENRWLGLCLKQFTPSATPSGSASFGAIPSGIASSGAASSGAGGDLNFGL